MIKNLPVLIFILLLSHFSTLPVWANKCGVNIGPNYQQVSQVANLTKAGGWVVALGTPGNCTNFESLFGKGLNVVIRAYNGGQAFTNSQALGWVATLGKMDTKGQIIYFMPWNEPNHPEECGGQSCTSTQVITYVNFLKEQLSSAGLLNSKVVLLSPMIDKLNPTFPTFQNVYNQGLGNSINEYDQAADPSNYVACQHSNPALNNCLYNSSQVGISGPYYALESGVAGTGSPPAYKDNEISAMFSGSWKYWSADNNFQMFAVFSYDPHRTGWNIFSAPQTISFYQNNCSPGIVSAGNFGASIFQQWLNSNQDKLVSCGGCGYAPDKGFCTGAGPTNQSSEPEIIELKNSLVCNDFDFELGTETKTEITPTPVGGGQVRGASAGDVQGNLIMRDSQIFDFSKLENTFSLALTRLLPAESQTGLSIDNQPLQSKVKHYVSGKESKDGLQTKAEDPAKSMITYPSRWTKLIGESRIFCGLFNTCPPPKSLTIKIAKADPPEAPSEKTNCLPGNQTETEPVAETSTVNSAFKTRSFWDTFIETITDLIGKIFNRTRTVTPLTNKTRANLTGGQNFTEYAEFLESFLSSGSLPENRNGAVAAPVKYQASTINSQTKDLPDEKLNYQNQELNHARQCLALCSFSPAGTDLSTYGCTSCKANDYQLTSAPVSNLPVPAQACSADKPYENIPSCTICQNILFCSGNNYRLCPTDNRIPAPALGSRNEGWWFSSGDFPDGIVLYNGEEFPVPSGGVYVCDSNVHGCVDPRCQ